MIYFWRNRSAYPAAVVKIQAAIRGFLGRKRGWREYFSRLAMEHAGAKEVSQKQTLFSSGCDYQSVNTYQKRRHAPKCEVYKMQWKYRRPNGFLVDGDREGFPGCCEQVEHFPSTIGFPPSVSRVGSGARSISRAGRYSRQLP